MTTTVEASSTSAEPSQGGTPDGPDRAASRGSRIAAVTLGAIVVLGGLAWAAVAVTQSVVLGAVSVGYDAQPVVCEGTTVETSSESMGDEYRRPVIIVNEAFTCELRVQVINDSGVEITVDAVGLANLAHGAEIGIQAVGVSPNGGVTREVDGVLVYDVDGGIAVAPGQTQSFTTILEAGSARHTEPCAGYGWNIPQVTVSALGASRTLAPPERDLIWVQYGSAEECALPE